MAKKKPSGDTSVSAFNMVRELERRDAARSAGLPIESKAQTTGTQGGRTRAQKLTPERRSEIASAAAKKRWG